MEQPRRPVNLQKAVDDFVKETSQLLYFIYCSALQPNKYDSGGKSR